MASAARTGERSWPEIKDRLEEAEESFALLHAFAASGDDAAWAVHLLCCKVCGSLHSHSFFLLVYACESPLPSPAHGPVAHRCDKLLLTRWTLRLATKSCASDLQEVVAAVKCSKGGSTKGGG